MAPKFAAPSAEQIVALSTVVVGIGPGGRVSVVNYKGAVLYEYYVAPTNPVTDYRHGTTGIQAHHLASAGARRFSDVQREVADIIRGKVVVGHSLWLDLSVLGIPHPAVNTRDVGLYQPFRNALQATQLVGLATLTWKLMMRRIQDTGRVCSTENARAALDLYRSHAAEWEAAISDGHWPTFIPPERFSRCYL
ncbi:hypothetical protein PHLGIDRAFT_113607 [Phlebiopsis gigantea 11061_1 CR5-6]|uniref:Exonuclease domain-containing protein n=1 Tax=Phlebiopsis gigantea (strain 11061_1 CR5-6) TaxID=745531 RepID=A0A0C3SFR1_PHLG1|nr:hypothetical protein PHLGIDRAFT_113607 [Phlebiopsis gigantea 11061_1 CR5-6]